ncbi:OmpA family protein [Tautonia plasticadhaerens]|uniref:Putative lipoprotein YiaD n=1 Tax=Tautonia plasticadhaerens TaxID=2527974 RepID=A0A518H5I8_9BACT|nr:OmpA family protein [Tautonia plasticadhaerens]QDV36078.1 putative lipoprotein YiaD precursor [Tautonia plasticadhaerens]
MTPEVAWERANPAGRVDAQVDRLQHPTPPPSLYLVWNFAVGSHTLKPEHRALLRSIVPTLRNGPNAILVQGFGSSSGGVARNQQLGHLRASEVRAFLVAEGITRAKIQAPLSSGEQFPIVPNTTPENMARNRRVEIHLLLSL